MPLSHRNGSGNGSSDFRAPTELERAIARYVDLYEFSTVAYVSFDRVGRIEEANHAALKLLGRPKRLLIGTPFAMHVLKADAGLFLNHLLRCRSLKKRVETELRMKKRSGKPALLHLTSSPTTSSIHEGADLYHTAIIDLTENRRAEMELRRSQERYRTLFNLVPVAVYTCDADGLIHECNQRAVELWGREPKIDNPKEKFCGSFKIFYPDGSVMPHAECPMARALRGETLQPSDLEITVQREDGMRRDVVVSPRALRNERGKIVGAINCLYDITDRKQTEAALRESEDFHRALVSQTAVGMARTDLKGKVTFVNREFCEMLGFTKEELLGKSISDFTHPDDLAESLTLFRGIVRRSEPYRIEKRYIRKDGSVLWANVSASPMRDDAGKTCSAVAVILDIGARKQAQAILEERARGLEREVLEISDREQRRLGQDLHDSLCQHLTAITFMTRAIGEQVRAGRGADPKELDEICNLINEGVTEARTVARGLHPVEMDPSGLTTALTALLTEKSQLPCRLDLDDEIPSIDPTVALHLYRIAREAVINANKHARARELIVRMHSSPKQLELSVTDDGVGISRDAAAGPGLGFHIMQYRARSIGARLEISPVKPHGTRVACYLPRK